MGKNTVKLSEIVKAAREKKGISQQRLAKHLGYTSPQFISNFERNECDLPFNKIKKVCKFLGIDLLRAKEILIGEYTNYVYKTIK